MTHEERIGTDDKPIDPFSGERCESITEKWGKQSERFQQAARELGADESSDVFDRIVEEKARSQKSEKK
jgi:hypothetical protein